MLSLTIVDLLAIATTVFVFNVVGSILLWKFVMWRFSHWFVPEQDENAGAAVSIAGLDHVQCPSCEKDAFGVDYCPDCGAEMEVLHDA